MEHPRVALVVFTVLSAVHGTPSALLGAIKALVLVGLVVIVALDARERAQGA
jgi:hypothetical protein